MEKRTKDTHIAVRTTVAAKTYTVYRLKAIGSPYTLSAVYNRLSAGQGLVSADDAAAIARLRRIITRLRHVVLPPAPAERDAFENVIRKAFRQMLFPGKAALLNALVDEVARLGEGCQPLYLFGQPGQPKEYERHRVVDQVLGQEGLTGRSAEWIAERCKGVRFDKNKFVKYGAKYTIRAAWDDRPTTTGKILYSKALRPHPDARLAGELSDRVRDYLNYLEDIPSATDAAYDLRISPVEQAVESVAEFAAAFWSLDASHDQESAAEAFKRHSKVLRECTEAVASLKNDL